MPNFYENLLRPAMFGLDAETAHEIGIESVRLGLSSDLAQRIALKQFASEAFPEIKRFGLTFRNPLGMAAGFDKNGIVVNQLASLGFGFVEVGTVTLTPQKGNERPRLFRLSEDEALINRLGFNNEGAAVVAGRLKDLRRRCVVGVNIGRNKDVPNEEAVANYLATFDLIHDVADYIALNVSSPNTPNLRDLQRAENLEELIGALMDQNRILSHAKPILVKIAPDLTSSEIDEIVDLCVRLDVSGIIATNTTVSREGLKSKNAEALGVGGLSGRPLAKRSNEVIRSIYRRTEGQLPIIGVGGIFTPEDAFEKIAAGACLIQAYTGFIYKGPSFARDINNGLQKILRQRGFASLGDAVGCQV